MSARPLSKIDRLRRALAAWAVVGLVLLPALHAPHAGSVAARNDLAHATFAAEAAQHATACPLCLFVAQAHTTLASPACATLAPSARGSGCLSAEAPRLCGAHFELAAPPRAPPV